MNTSKILILLIIISTTLVFVYNHYEIKKYEDILSVSETFSFYLIVGDPDHMKQYSSEKLRNNIDKNKYEKIDKYIFNPLRDEATINKEYNNIYENLGLYSIIGYANTYIFTYSLERPTIEVCSVVIRPKIIMTLWEQLLFKIHYAPFIGPLFGEYNRKSKARWEVDDYYTMNDLLSYYKAEKENGIKDDEEYKMFTEISKLPESIREKHIREEFDNMKIQYGYYIAEENKKILRWTNKELIKQYWEARDRIYESERNYTKIDNKIRNIMKSRLNLLKKQYKEKTK